jgi:DNA-binding transcriptional regulator YhcF (GntR family)
MSPYLRIVEDLRRRVDRGELAPGDRVPSTRDLAESWRVAMATAAHALRTLAEQGYVRSVPRVGTVVADPRRRLTVEKDRAAREGELSRARIVAAAIDIADREGLGALSLRAVAAKVEAPVMSLYRHVENKDELQRLMADAALGEERLPPDPPAGWRAQLELGARTEWRVFRRHPWLARIVNLTRPLPLPNALLYAEWMFRALSSTGADAATQMHVHILLHAFVQGLAVNVETEADAAGETGLTDQQWMERQLHAFQSLASSGRYPAFAGLLATLGEFDLDLDALFELGLTAMLDGFTRLLQSRDGLPRKR